MAAPYYSTPDLTLHVGDCRKVLPLTLADDSVDAIVCDPPYELAFMGRGWDASGVAFDPVTWRECLRVLKPGGHLVAFGGTRTWHRVAVAIEDAGFELRDTLMWVYGSGFPKSLDVSKAIDKAAGAQREVIGDKLNRPGYHLHGHDSGTGAFGKGIAATTTETRLRAAQITAPATEDAARWEGWGTALKPGWEPIILARKPLAGTVVQNVTQYGTGALNIAACRIPPTGESRPRTGEASQDRRYTEQGGTDFAPLPGVRGGAPEGRWPANVVFTHHAACVEDGPCRPDCPVVELDRQSGTRTSGTMRAGVRRANRDGWAGPMPAVTGEETHGDSGGASRFFPTFRYEAKAPTSERPKLDDGTAHATVKPLSLIRWLVRLVAPRDALILDPFGGSGTTGEAAITEGFRAVLVELEPSHAELIKQRLSKNIQPVLFGEVADA